MENGTAKIFNSAILFLGSFAVWTIPYKDWRFFDDDYGAIYIGTISSFAEIKDYFGSNPNDRSILPSNMRDATPWSFFGVMYRPLALIMYAAEVYLFGPFNPRAYFFVSMALHAACGVMLFYLFSFLMPLLYAFFCAITFLFYPIMGEFIGRFVMQTYSIALLGVGFSIAFLRGYLDSEKKMMYFLSLFIFGTTLFVHEIVVVFPVWLLCVLPFYFDASAFPSLRTFLRGAFFAAGYFGVVVFNLMMRALVYPVSMKSNYMVLRPMEILWRLKIRIFDLITLVIDALGLTAVPGGNRLRKSIVLLVVLMLLLIVFVRSKRKRDAVVLGLGFFLFSWPAFAITHQARYLYLGLPFLLGAFGILLSSQRRINKFLTFCWLAIPISGLLYGAASTFAREKKYIVVDNAFKKLARNDFLFDKPICFVGAPKEWIPHPGAAQAIWIYRGNSSAPVCHDPQLNVCCLEKHSPLDEMQIPRDAIVDISVQNNVVHIVSKTPEKAWVWTHNPFGQEFKCSMGERRIIKASSDRGFEIAVILNKKWSDLQLKFVTWDFNRQKFKII
ncbi:hypothetical protein KAU11_00965 [Candidatus Babeliales bacterium]|nr:hypothetical protein [Candidatus Babeliales bacterium]